MNFKTITIRDFGKKKNNQKNVICLFQLMLIIMKSQG